MVCCLIFLYFLVFSSAQEKDVGSWEDGDNGIRDV
jgi:hypothetical protein